jgi:tRNA G18 (ribose-2'-O)-methylase SpoU
MSDNQFDEELVRNGDNRNVVDDYKTWTVEAIKANLADKAFPVHVAIENYQHDYNIGTIVRAANAFNVSGVHIVGKRHWNRRGAMATEKYLELYHHTDVEAFRAWAKEHNLDVIGVDNIEGSQLLAEAALTKDIVLVFGQEGPGLSEDMQAICSNIVAIEQFGSTRSVNVGVAAGIILYEWVRRNAL